MSERGEIGTHEVVTLLTDHYSIFLCILYEFKKKTTMGFSMGASIFSTLIVFVSMDIQIERHQNQKIKNCQKSVG